MMQKKILVLYYSQFGQTKTMVDIFKDTIDPSLYTLECHKIEPEHVHFPTPWSITKFFSIFPLCMNQECVALKPITLNQSQYDLIVIAGQIWFLSPSIPLASILKNDAITALFSHTPILCLISARNMWFKGMQKFKENINAFKPSKISSFILTDTSPSWATFVTTPRWMLTGKRNAFWFFPEAGIKQSEFLRLREFVSQFNKKNFNFATIDSTSLTHWENSKDLLIEKLGYKVFSLWASIFRIINKKSGFLFHSCILLFRIHLIISIVLFTLLSTLVVLFFRHRMDTKFRMEQQLLLKG